MFTPAIFVTPSGWPAITQAQRSEEALSPGVAHARWRLVTAAGPLELSIATVDLRNPAVKLTVETQHGAIVGPDEPLSAMADRVGAVAGINGDYYDINASGGPINLVVTGGRVEHQPSSAAALVVGVDNRIAMGPLAWHAEIAKPDGTVLTVEKANDWSPAASLTLVTAHLGTTDGGGATEVVLGPSGDDRFRVLQVASNLTTLLPLAPDQVALAAHGDAANELAAGFHSGDDVRVDYRWDAPVQPVAAVGGGPLLLRGGAPYADSFAPAPQEANVRYPVSGAGISADSSTLWLVTVDGRAPGRSVGISRPMFAGLFAALGASDAMAFDSGGSAEMVVRHLGDFGVSVAGAPSDGRERAIADGLFILNAAAAGPAARLILRVPAPALLVGSRLTLSVRAVDANLQPVTVDPAQVAFAPANGCHGAIVGPGSAMRAVQPGCADIAADAGGIQGDVARVTVVDRVAQIAVTGYDRFVPTGKTVRFGAAAKTADALPVAVDPEAVRWSSTGTGARMRAHGALVTGIRPARVDVTAYIGDASRTETILVGEHAAPIALLPSAWRYKAIPADLPGGVDDEQAPDGAAALRLGYDFSRAGSTRAAYAQAAIGLGGAPLAIAIEVYGDGNGAWLRAAYRNADGVDDTITLARRIQWTGWKTIRVAMPASARFPITLTRLYAIEPNPKGIEQGSLWFRNLEAIYPGP